MNTKIFLLALSVSFLIPSLFAMEQLDLETVQSKVEVKRAVTPVPIVFCRCVQAGYWHLILHVEDALTGKLIGEREISENLTSLDECQKKWLSNPRCR